ncbi:ABC transporter permease [Dyadobacter sp. CY356]|uniref:ABC transporter permease n=1 Tax=Dyadobacter sp. CY356 TaxID=2906442 RepID=UPI001F199AE3|nr:ABC transporter permease [Dyadobacter sp. CY356]MCF0057927.1 ABC transporter permease [Dyadobacter sp. CY356]
MLKNYFKIALRNLQRSKAYAFINVLGLALGITCAILIFTLVRYHLSFDNFHPNSDRVYRMLTEFHNETVSLESGVPSPLGKAFRNDFAFAEKTARVIAYGDQLISLPGSKDNKKFEEENGVAYAEPEFFDIMNFPLLEGDRKTALLEPNTAIVTEKIAEKYFGKTNAIGQLIRINNETNYKITGILKDIPVNTDRNQEIYLPYENLKDENPWIAKDDSWMGVYSGSNCFVLLKEGVAQATVEKSLPLISKKYYSAKDAPGWQFKLQPLSDIHFNAELGGYMEKKNLWALTFIGIFLIVTACVNFVNLATAQALSRSKEIGVRKVLGSLKSQLFWQFISETALITFFALLIGLILSYIALPYVNELFKAHLTISLISDITLILFLLGLVVTVTFFSGSYPGLILAGFQPILALKGKISQKSAGGFTLRRGLVVTQFAISQILIIGTIVIANQMRFSKQSDLGFNKDAMVMMPLPVNDLAKMSTLKSRITELPGVKSGTFCFNAPAASSNNTTGLRYDARAEDEQFGINMKSADDQYLKTFGLKLVAGRNIMPSDTLREFVVNETLVKKLKLKSADEILGKLISINGNTQKARVVGVVKDFYNYSFRSNIDPICIMANYTGYRNYAVNVNMANMKPTMAAIEKIWSETYPEYVFKSAFLDDKIAEFYALDDIMLKLIQFFAGVAIFIGCLGLYGLVSFMAAQKTKEIGVRKVLGASIGNIVWMFGKEFIRLLFIAFVIAAPLAWWVMNGWLQDFKYREEIGAGIFLLAIGATLLIAALTVGYRSVSAALMDPVKSLKSE